jgi:methylenetetrahydrofolate dehydrogenase (NADP+)/methenyltetrahydrofolate cyclohydrolase
MKAECRAADIVVAAAGVAKMLDASYLSEGAVVIDVGINVDADGNLCGDVDFDSACEKAFLITPVPGGVGSVTTSVLAKHLLQAAKQA